MESLLACSTYQFQVNFFCLNLACCFNLDSLSPFEVIMQPLGVALAILVFVKKVS
jgi:hypothetical protein